MRLEPEEATEPEAVVEGEISFTKRSDNDRELDIKVRWTAARREEATGEKDAASEQTWAMC